MQDAFSRVDSAGEGVISLADFGRAVRETGLKVPEEQLRTLEASARSAAGPEGLLTAYEFCRIMAQRGKLANLAERCREAFAAFDKDGDGIVSPDDLRALFVKLGDKLTAEQAGAMLASVGAAPGGEASGAGAGSPGAGSAAGITFAQFTRLYTELYG